MSGTIHNRLYFSIALSTVLILQGCTQLNREVVFNGYGHQGTHARALMANGDFFVAAGSKGVYTIGNFDGTIIKQDSIPGMEDFRDVQILQDGTILFMNSGKKGEIWAIKDENQTKVFDSSDVFLDGMDFWNDTEGMAFGDPVDDKLFLIKTSNGGMDWSFIDQSVIPKALTGEAGFAASGTGIQCVGESTVFIGTGGGEQARLFRSFDKGKTWDVVETPMHTGESFGIYSMYFWSDKEGVIIGGSYLEKEHKEKICFYTNDAGETWKDISKGLGGYCSGIHGDIDASLIIATGRIGTFYTLNKGKTWNWLTDRRYYSVFVTQDHIFLSGKDGILEIKAYKI